MSQHLSQSDIKNFLDQTLGSTGLLRVDSHLADCEECGEQIAHIRMSTNMAVLSPKELFKDDAESHLTYEQLAAYVDREINDVEREIVDVHREVCRDCASQIDDLFDLRNTLQLESESGAMLPTASSSTGWWTNLTSGSFLKFAVPAFGLVLLGTLVWTVWMSSNGGSTIPDSVVDVTDTPSVASDVVNSEVVEDTNSNTETSKPIISLADGGTRIEIDEKGNLTGLNSPQFESRVRSALTTQNIQISSAEKELRARSGVLMGDGQPGVPFALAAPVGKLIESDRPRFNWRPLNGAESYVVAIFDASFNKVTESPKLTQPGWTPAAPLKRGGVYQWQVTAVKDGQEIRSPVRPAPDARFKVLDAAAANDIAAAKRQAGRSHLLLGIAYAGAGLLDEAEREFRALVNQNPGSEIAKRLLQKVRAAR